MASKKEQKEEARRQREEREAEERKKARRKRRIWQIGAVAVVVVAIIVIAVAVSSSGGSGGNKPSKKETQSTSSTFDGLAQTGITLGNPQAKVTIYEFADLQCPFCRQYTLSLLEPLVNKYVRPGKVKMVWRNLTFIGPDSVTAARAAAAAGAQNRLWQFVDLFYHQQGTENSGYVTDKFLQNIASSAGLDVGKWKADQSAPLVEQQLGEAQQQAAQFKINSTPSFLIQVGNGKPTKLNYSDFKMDQFTGPIDAALKQAGQQAGG